MNNLLHSPTVSFEDFFYDEPDLTWQPLPEHDLEQSPCCPIIDIDKLKTIGKTFYRCKIHPDVWNIDLLAIEHHYKYHEPNKHKAEILKLLSKEQNEYEDENEEKPY